MKLTETEPEPMKELWILRSKQQTRTHLMSTASYAKWSNCGFSFSLTVLSYMYVLGKCYFKTIREENGGMQGSL